MNVSKALGLLASLGGRAANRPLPAGPESAAAAATAAQALSALRSGAQTGAAVSAVGQVFAVAGLREEERGLPRNGGPRPAALQGDDTHQGAELSAAGRLLQALDQAVRTGDEGVAHRLRAALPSRRDAPGEGGDGVPDHPGVAPDRVSAPLLAEAEDPGGAPATHLAARLRTAIEESGLFYESHLASWAEGGRSLAAVAGEPQGHLDPQARGRLVASQIDALAFGTFAWAGQVWTGQTARIAWREDAPPARAEDRHEPGHAWRVEVTLDHATLGEITADLSATGIELAVGVACRRDATRAGLEHARGDLTDRLAGSGLRLTRLDVTADA